MRYFDIPRRAELNPRCMSHEDARIWWRVVLRFHVPGFGSRWQVIEDMSRERDHFDWAMMLRLEQCKAQEAPAIKALVPHVAYVHSVLRAAVHLNQPMEL